MFRGFFNADTPFWRWVGSIPSMIGLSLCWYICCIPIITIIPACCALFDAVSRALMKDNDKGAFQRFFRTFVHELKRGIPLTILWLIIAGLAIFSYLIVAENWGVFTIVYVIMLLMLVAYMNWLIPLESRYYNTFLQLHINAMKLYIGRLPSSILMLLSTVGVVVVSLINAHTCILLTVAPCLIAVLHTLQVEKTFKIIFPQDYEDDLPIYTEQEPIYTKKTETRN